MFDIKKSIIQIAELQLGATTTNDDATQSELHTDSLNNFLQNGKVLLLCAFLGNHGNLIFSNQLPDFDCEKTIVFSKRQNSPTNTEHFLKNLNVCTVSGKPTLDLYEFLHNIYVPFFEKHNDKRIKRNILLLQSDLKSLIVSENTKNDTLLLTYVSSLEDEKNYWKSIAESKSDRLSRKSAEAFLKLLHPLVDDLRVIESLPGNDVEDLLEKCHNTFDDLWRCDPGYPKDRMKNLMDIIAFHLYKYMGKQFQECDIWMNDYNEILEKCSRSINLGDKWLTTCKQLTGLYWPSHFSNPWKEEPYEPAELIQIVSTLREVRILFFNKKFQLNIQIKVITIRTAHKQLLRLSTQEEQRDLDCEKIFKPFKVVEILTYDDRVSEDLTKAKKEFEYLLEPAEERVALKLKKQIMSVKANIRQLIYEFIRYSELIDRPVLRKNLQAERQFLLKSLTEYITQIQNQVNLDNSKVITRQETSETIKEIIVIRQLEAKAKEVIIVIEKLLYDLESCKTVKDFALVVLNDLKSQHTELFDAWSSDLIANIQNNKLSLKEKDPVVEFSKDKLMKVNYPSRLITLISEIRQLKAMGYHIPSLIEETGETAKKFMKYARLLEQIANFHNTIGDRMISSQKPMMLSSALELSKLVQEQEVVSWGEEKQVDKYVNNLKKAVAKLSESNNFLTSIHIEIMDKIQDLDNNLKSIVLKVENAGFTNMQSWKNEIDLKICDVLEKAYIKNLDTLHLTLQEIHVDLIYRSSELGFSPNREKLDQIYDEQMKKYLNIPKTFKGLSQNSENIFGKINNRNQELLEKNSKKKEELFDQLDAVLKHWQSWMQLEPLDAKKLITWEHWDLHFRASKTFGQEIAKLPSTEERVGCFLISLSRLRSDLESHNRSYWDQLVFSLKDSIAEDVVKLQNYIDPATANLVKQPVTMEEFGECGFSYANITAAYTEMEATYKEMLNKSKILASWSREQVDSVNRLKGAWERLGSLINNHQYIMARQMETVRTSLNIEQENLAKEVEFFEAKWGNKSFDFDENTIEGVSKLFQEFQAKRSEWNVIIEKKEALCANFTKFNLEIPNIQIINAVDIALKEDDLSWSLFKEFNLEFEKFVSQHWIVFRKKYSELDDFITTWENRLNNHSENTTSRFVPVILQELEKYKEITPILKYVKGEDFSEKHWSDLFNILDMTPKQIDQILLKDFLDVHQNLLHKVKELQTLSRNAASQIVIRQALKDIDQWEVQAKFVLNNHTDSQGKQVLLIKDFKDVLNSIGDHQILLQSLKHSGNIDTFMEKANYWENKLENLNFCLTLLTQVQKRWLYLEPIFGSGTLAQEKTRFERLDRDFRKIMTSIEKDTRVTEICKYANLKSTLQYIMEQLSRCQHSLDNFLKEKRHVFPRFLFISDDDLLEIVGQASKEEVIQSHLKKLFAGIHSVQLNSSRNYIIGIRSVQGEEVKLLNSIDIKRSVEEWLGQLVEEMRSTLKQLLVDCQKESQSPDPLKYPSQILCLSDNISFTQKCEQAISSMTLPALLAKYKAQLTELSSLELNDNMSNESQVLEIKLKSLLLDTIHHIRVLEELLNMNVMKTTDWVWQKQLRYYSHGTGEVTIRMGKAKMNYSYEYLGNEQKLVRTPLTERCFLTLTQAIELGLGGNPFGPAGTGKTESVKALGSILGRQVLVFNCDEGLDVTSMERILTGLVKTGAWGCFDEFNRLDETTLSSISMNIHAIQQGLRNNTTNVHIGNMEIPLDRHCGIFVTLNPAGEGYGARNKLPDNLKQLFRPVVMTHPDHEEIARTSLYCDGFRYADILAKKIVELLESCSKILSKQQHYDWGLRTIKTLVSACQSEFKKICNGNNRKTVTLSKDEETNVIINTLKLNIVSKLTYSDAKKFDEIIESVFKSVSMENFNDENLKNAIIKSYSELNLIANERQVRKCLEFYTQIKQRMGVAVIGPSGSGKSTIMKIVAKAIVKMDEKIKTYPLNPKSMPRQLLLGYTDHLNQWNDGVLTNYGMQVTSENEDIWSWIICDGDIDPNWVESLNSVLDDNRLMTLPTGCRIHFGPKVNFIFETDNLKNASPATISRIGIVYLNSEDVNLNDFVKTRLMVFPEDQRNNLESFFKDYFFKAIDWTEKEAELTLKRSKISVVESCLAQFTKVNEKLQFIVALNNGLTYQFKPEFRDVFTERIFDWADETPPSITTKLFYDEQRHIVDTYYTDPNILIPDINQGLPLVKTGQVLQYLDILKGFVEKNFLLAGPHGSAKRLMVENSLLKEGFDGDIVEIHCSSNISTNYIINKLQQYCISVNTFHGTLLKPKRSRLLLYLKDLHLLSPDQWGNNMITEFLIQLIDYKGYFNNKTEFIRIENITIIGALQPTNFLSSRFLSKFHLLSVELPDREDLSVILVAYLSAVLSSHFSQVTFPKAKIVKLVLTMLTIYERFQESPLYQNQKFCPLTPHDLIRWCTNLKYYTTWMVDDSTHFENHILETTCYEAIKIFIDRLPSMEAKISAFHSLNEIFKNNWNVINITQESAKTYYVPRMDTLSKRVVFDKFSKENWQLEVEKGLKLFNKEEHTLNTIINEEILFMTSIIMRNLTIPNYNLVLVGKSGCGRKTSLKISSALLSKKIIHPVSATYPYFQNDIKMAIQYAGLDCEDVMLLLEDYHLESDDIKTIVNLLASAGEVFDLYTDVEMESLLKGLKEKLDSENFEGSLSQFFVNNIKKHLHLFVCLDEDNGNLREIVHKCPIFSQNSGLVWLSQWSMDTIKSFPEKLIKSMGNHESNTSNDIFEIIYHSLPYSVPLRYTVMIRQYVAIFQEKNTTIISKKGKLEAGVSKLTDAKNLVDELKQKAAEQQEKLAEKQEKANAALDMISNTIKGANTHKEEMEVLKRKTESENVLLVKRQQEIEEELREVEPLIEEARAAVGNIKTESLSEIRSLRAPPEIIRDILEGVLKLMGTQDTSWNSMKTFLAKRGIKEEIRSFDASRIRTENRQSVERLMSMKKDSFDQKFAKRASVAAAPLAAWVDANVKYSKVLDKIRPLEKEQHKLKENLDSAEGQLVQLNANLSDVDARVTHLKEQLSQFTKEAAEIEIGLNEVNQTLGSAENLVYKLEDEYERWQFQLKEISAQIESLSTDSLVASAFIVFLSEKEDAVRREMVENWTTQFNKENHKFNFINFFSSEREQLQWQFEGLSNDKVTLENVLVMRKSLLKPLLIDPNSTTINWLKTHYTKCKLNFEHVVATSEKFNTVLEASIRFGKILLIEELNEVPSSLFPILREDYIIQGERKMFKMLGRLIDCHSDFKLIMCSRNERVQMPNEIASYVCVLNFNVTRSGLVEQLLSAAIIQEKPNLEVKRQKCLQENEELQDKLFLLQTQLLECLANSDGNILNNKNLIVTLNETKSSSTAVADALEESIKIRTALRKEYEIFLDIASFGSQLYFACQEFSKLDILYSLSVQAFSKLFLTCLQTIQQEDANLQKNQLFKTVYNYMSRGMFKNTRLYFLLHLVYKTLPNAISQNEMSVFLGTSFSNDVDSDNIPPWIPSMSISGIRNIKCVLPEIYTKCKFDEKILWNDFMQFIGEMEFPKHCQLSDFQKVLIVQALKPDKMLNCLETFCLRISGLRTIDPPVLSLQSVFNESTCQEPILLITTSGLDPSSEIADLAKQLKQEFEEISMGEGSESKTMVSLEECRKCGKWMILKNLHLVTYWLAILAQYIKQSSPIKNFRLWLISERTEKFNNVLAQNCLKVAYEEPQGIGNNIQRIYTSLGEKYNAKLNRTSARIFFVFSFLHSLLQERRKYIPQGWFKYYEFNNTDLQTGINLTEDLWNIESYRLDWLSIRGLLQEAVYGGRIECIEDMNILEAYLKIYFKDDILSHKWKPQGIDINLPNANQIDTYLQAVKQLPNKDSPVLFGLPENVDREREKQMSIKLIKILKRFYQEQKKESLQDLNFKELQPIFNLWKRLNQGQDFIKQKFSEEIQSNSSLTRFILEEYQQGLCLIQRIHRDLTNLNKISKSIVEPNESDFLLATSMLQGQTPKSWLEKWNGPKNLNQYLTDLLQKSLYISSLKSFEIGELLKQPVKLQLFFNPETFLACSRKDFASHSNIPLDELVLQTNWRTSGNDYIILENILIEGGLLEHNILKECNRESDSINIIPNCYLNWVEKDKFNSEDFVKFPLYTFSNRESKIAYIQVKCENSQKEKYILSGLAFYLQY
ncbi:hypothetical protein ABEB36_005769 [Hypothenemus hampei]|uniref:Dynein heavy chain, cytoplasmic n=1 Tax=Hypothenemus hampei TaxID=57062 RepID=A0ABD1EZS9_HYPHA